MDQISGLFTHLRMIVSHVAYNFYIRNYLKLNYGQAYQFTDICFEINTFSQPKVHPRIVEPTELQTLCSPLFYLAIEREIEQTLLKFCACPEHNIIDLPPHPESRDRKWRTSKRISLVISSGFPLFVEGFKFFYQNC